MSYPVGKVNLLELYENDISKHNGKIEAGRILLVFRSLVTQLSKENEKFIYGCVKQGARAREFEVAIEWLVSAGLVLRVYNVKKPEHPLKAFEDLSSFKRYRNEENPALAIRLSTLEYKKQENMINVPLYLACRINRI